MTTVVSRKPLILAVANQKGGVGKTTTAVNLSAAMARLGFRALLVDLDPQANATMGSGVDKSSLTRTVYPMLVGLESARAVRVSTPGGYDLLPANRDLAGAEVELVDLDDREHRLAKGLVEIGPEYDIVVIDCPPSLSLLTLNGLCAAHGVVIPMQCEYFALEGLSDLVNSIKRVHAGLNRDLRIIGLLRVMFDPRMTLSQQVSDQLERHFGEKVFKAVIPRNIRLAEAPSHGQSGIDYDATSRGSQAYLSFAEELVARMAMRKGSAAPQEVIS